MKLRETANAIIAITKQPKSRAVTVLSLLTAQGEGTPCTPSQFEVFITFKVTLFCKMNIRQLKRFLLLWAQ